MQFQTLVYSHRMTLKINIFIHYFLQKICNSSDLCTVNVKCIIHTLELFILQTLVKFQFDSYIVDDFIAKNHLDFTEIAISPKV